MLKILAGLILVIFGVFGLIMSKIAGEEIFGFLFLIFGLILGGAGLAMLFF